MDCQAHGLELCIVSSSFGALSTVFLIVYVSPKQIFLIWRHYSLSCSFTTKELYVLYIVLAYLITMVVHYFIVIPDSNFDILYFLMLY